VNARRVRVKVKTETPFGKGKNFGDGWVSIE